MSRLPSIFVLLGLCTAGFLIRAQDVSEEFSRVGVPFDWSHRHLIFSQPQTNEGLSQAQLEPRYWHQLFRQMYQPLATGRIPVIRGRTAHSNAIGIDPARPVPFMPALGAKVDWSSSLGTATLIYSNIVSYPAKYNFNVANPVPNCTSDYVVFTIPTATTTRPNIVAYNNLYVDNSGTGTCAGTNPNLLFAYNASQSSGNLQSSPTLSLDGTKIAFIENAGKAQFHVLKWKSGNTSATFFQPFNSSVLADCATNGAVAPCEYSVAYSGNAGASLSAPYVDYPSDTAYVTDDKGLLAAISPVFGAGTPVVTYTVSVSSNKILTAPVYDPTSKNVFVSDSAGVLRYVRTSASSSGTCLSGSPPCVGGTALNVTNNKQIFDSPIVDSSTGKVFVFANNSTGGTNSTVVQASTILTGAVVANVGTVGTQNAYAGTFNNAYYTNPGTGLLYVCGTNAANIPQLYGVSFSGSTMVAGTAVNGPLALATAAAGCSPLTEVFNTSTSRDYVYGAVTTKCTATITGGCMRAFDVTSGFPASALATVAETSGTTGIIVDNVNNGGNASATNIYFITLGNQSCTKYTGGTAATAPCAVKLTQSALQ